MTAIASRDDTMLAPLLLIGGYIKNFQIFLFASETFCVYSGRVFLASDSILNCKISLKQSRFFSVRFSDFLRLSDLAK